MARTKHTTKQNDPTHPTTPPTPIGIRPVGPTTLVHVHDGDSLTLLIDKENTYCRLRSIDAPELDQPFGLESKFELVIFLSTPNITFSSHGVDKYGRYLIDIFDNEKHRYQDHAIGRGYAWVFEKYAEHEHWLHTLQFIAREQMNGLWRLPGAIAPWEFRAAKKASGTNPMNLVYHGISSKAFHQRSCPNLHYPYVHSTKLQAIGMKLTPCKNCNP